MPAKSLAAKQAAGVPWSGVSSCPCSGSLVGPAPPAGEFCASSLSQLTYASFPLAGSDNTAYPASSSCRASLTPVMYRKHEKETYQGKTYS